MKNPEPAASIQGTILAVIGAVLLFSALVSAGALRHQWQSTKALTMEDLPHSAIYIPHDDGTTAAMRHYATPEAGAVGGPIYGISGYRIVSIEYELPLAKIGTRLVGKEDPGQVLKSTALFEKANDFAYDHFHVGVSAHEHLDADSVNENLIIHFMLISHEEETAMGLSCG